MTQQAMQSIQCSKCETTQEVPVWSSLNVGLDPGLRQRLFQGEINKFCCSNCQYTAFLDSALLYHDMRREFAVQYYPPQYLNDPKFFGHFEPGNPPIVKGLPKNMGYLRHPHIVFNMNELLNCIVFHERIRGAEIPEK